ncbi:hypothetical protein M3Y94_00000500 [Aphelenchoides besseyi]|nr:hypothetical protein M3Y94_00000500 [Aphelenchoides besseyi]KAI6220805.1 hypothetical protein M3Y95_01035200 [Aphelenchoides besseyi]
MANWLSRWNSRFGAWIRRSFGNPYSEAFDSNTVRLFHRRDRLSSNEWLLIYNNLNGYRYGYFLRLLVPSTIFVTTFAYLDYRKNPRFTYPAFQKLRRDFRELGFVGKIIPIFMSMTLFVCLRYGHVHVIRIYQNRAHPERFCVIRPKALIYNGKKFFERADVQVRPMFYVEDQWNLLGFVAYVLRMLRGEVLLGRTATMFDTDCFLANNLRTFMLKETHVLPPQLGK